MKPFALFILFLTFGLHSSAQNFQLKLLGSSKSEIKTLDSLDYTKKHKNLKSIADELTATSEKLSKMGYFENRILENAKENDSSYVAKFNLGEKINNIHMYKSLCTHASVISLLSLLHSFFMTNMKSKSIA